MVSLSYKSKQYLVGTLKVLILAVAFWYLYTKIRQIGSQEWDHVVTTLKSHPSVWLYAILFSVLAFLNWLLEIIKWKTLVSHLTSISISTAAKESLASFTVSIATPNRVGEYGAKAMYYPTQKRKQILVLNLIGNLSQLAATLFFGVIGLVYLATQRSINILKINIVLCLLTLLAFFLLAYLLRKKTWFIKGFSLQKIWDYMTRVTVSKKALVFILAIARYLTFSLLFYSILYFFGGHTTPIIAVNLIPFFETMAVIFSMYLTISLLPTLAIFDIAVKGSVAIWLFGLVGISEIPVLCTVLLMWLLNVMFPALLGSFFVVNYKTSMV